MQKAGDMETGWALAIAVGMQTLSGQGNIWGLSTGEVCRDIWRVEFHYRDWGCHQVRWFDLWGRSGHFALHFAFL